MKEKTKEPAWLRIERLAGTNNGATLRTRTVKDKTKYTRKTKHKGKAEEKNS